MNELKTNNNSNEVDPQLEMRKRNTTWIAGVTGVVMLLVTVAILPEVIRLGSDRIWGLVITTVFAIVSFTSAWISYRGRPNLAGGILVSTVLTLATFGTLLFSQNQGVALSVIIIFVASTIAFYTLPVVWVGRVIVISVAVGFLNILIDFYLPNAGLPNDPRYTNTIAIILSIIYLVITLRRFNQFALRTKLVLAFILIALVPVIMLGFLSTFITRNILIRQTNNDLVGTAQIAAHNIDFALGKELNAIKTEAQILTFADYLNLSANVRTGSPAEEWAYESLTTLQQKDPEYITSYSLLDIDGMVLLDTTGEDTGFQKAGHDYFVIPFKEGNPYISPLQISGKNHEPSIYLSAPVRNRNGDIIGVLRSRLKATYVQHLLKEAATSEYEQIAVLVDNEYLIRLADTADQSLILRSYKDLDDATIKDLQAQNRLLQGIRPDVILLEPEVAKGINNINIQPSFIVPSIIFGGENAYAGGARLTTMDWSVVVQRTERSILIPIENQTRAITLLSLLVIALAAGAGFMASQVLAQPLVQLSAVASDIASGNLGARAVAQTQDEVGTLANSFNRMTSQLQDTLGSLERRVAERTADVEYGRILSERRAQELQAISDISRIISSEQKFESLLSLIARLVSERFDFYHVGIFFIDNTRQYAVLQAANSEGGKRMLERGHKLEVGQTGLVGNVAKSGEPRIALDVGGDAIYFDNPDLPDTRSEMALPLNVHGETIGVLDIQSKKPGAFSENDTKTLSILADQIAIAIDNARLFEKNKQSLDELQSLYNQYLRQEWKTFVQTRPTVGYAQSIISGKPLEVPVESEEARRALIDGQVVILNAGETRLPSIAIPVKLRGQTIGVLGIQAPTKNRIWNQDEINLAQSISDRLALALDNARLLFVSQRQTAKEQKIGEVTAKIGASMNMRNVLQTAVEELGRALPGSEVVIQFQSNGKQE